LEMSAIVSTEEASNILNVASNHGTTEKPVEKNLSSVKKNGEKRYDPTEILSNVAQLSLSQNDVAKETTDLMNKLISREKVFSSAVNDFQVYCSQVMESVEGDAKQIRASATAEAALLVADAQFEDMQTFASIIKLNVGGHQFITSLATLCQYPDTMLGAMFSGRHTLSPEADGSYFIDRDGTHFRHILNLLRSPETSKAVAELPLSVQEELKCECDYYGLFDLMFPCKKPFICRNNKDKEIEITQDEEGRFCVNGYPIVVCFHCGSASYFGCGTSHEKPCIPYFRRIVVEKGGKVLSTQPTSDQPCYECGRSGN